MYIAMNRFKVQNGSEQAFENVWKGRDSSLSEMKGFQQFHLLRGPDQRGRRLHACLPRTRSGRAYEDFIAWTKSENFRAAHRNAGQNKLLYLGHPQFEGFSVVEGA